MSLHLLDYDFAEEHVVNLALQLVVGAAKNEIDQAQEVLVAILEHIIKLGSELSHGRLIKHEQLRQQRNYHDVDIELHGEHFGPLLQELHRLEQACI